MSVWQLRLTAVPQSHQRIAAPHAECVQKELAQELGSILHQQGSIDVRLFSVLCSREGYDRLETDLGTQG